jgi:hypothetical protein
LCRVARPGSSAITRFVGVVKINRSSTMIGVVSDLVPLNPGSAASK